VAFSVNQFMIVQAADIKKMDLSKIDSQINYQHLGPSYVYAENPSDPDLKNKIFDEVLSGGPDIERRPELYRDFKTNMSKAFNRSLDLDTLSTQFPGNKAIIDAFNIKYPNTTMLTFYPLLGKHSDVVIVLNKNSLEVIDYININPWKKLDKPATKDSSAIPNLPSAPIEQKK